MMGKFGKENGQTGVFRDCVALHAQGGANPGEIRDWQNEQRSIIHCAQH
jgi:hypothetical protein